MSHQVYQAVTDSIISELERGAIPWVKPWRADSTADRNVINNKPYQGINRLILGMASMIKNYDAPIWGSFQQFQQLGYNIKKGEKGTQIVFYKPVSTQKELPDGTIENNGYSVLKAYWIFNISQTDAPITKIQPDDAKPFNTISECENTLSKSGASIQHGGDGAFFVPSLDKINLPNKTAFNSESDYYATAFHELVHWSGAKHRLDRDLSGKYGNPSYAFEELIAEIGAAYLCADHRLQGELRHAGYIQSWLKALRDDNKAIFKAAAYAQKAADYITALDIKALPIAA